MHRYIALKNWLALTITRSVSTMECAFFFAILAVLGFPGAHATSAQYVQWVSTTFIQLVMLPLISVGQSLMSQMQEQHHSELQAQHEHHKREIAALHEKIDRLTPTKPLRDARGRFVKRAVEKEPTP